MVQPSADRDLETRVLRCLAHTRGHQETGALVLAMKAVGGQRTIDRLTRLVTGQEKHAGLAGYEALQVLAELAGADGLDVYRWCLRSRALVVQEGGVGLLGDFDEKGEAVTDVRAWLDRRLTKRLSRSAYSYQEVPLAVRYFARRGHLGMLAELLQGRESQLEDVEAVALERIWPKAERGRWLLGEKGAPPDTSGIERYGMPTSHFLEISAEMRGVAAPQPTGEPWVDPLPRPEDLDLGLLLDRLDARVARRAR